MKRVIYYGLIAVFVAIFLFSAWSLGSYYLGALENESLYDSLAQQMESAKDEPQPTVYFTPPASSTEQAAPGETWDPETPTLPDFESQDSYTILPEYAKLYLQNQDLVGWITIEGTNINYPVMQSPDFKDYYLDHSFEKKSSSRGSIYADEDCDVFAPSDNVILYGHHMRDGSMFSALNHYDSKSYWQEHRYITFNTLLEHQTYEIVAVFKTSATVGEGFQYHQFVDAETKEEFDEFIATCKRLAFYDTGVTAEYGDKLITLSTCEYTLTNGRLVVVAKRVETN